MRPTDDLPNSAAKPERGDGPPPLPLMQLGDSLGGRTCVFLEAPFLDLGVCQRHLESLDGVSACEFTDGYPRACWGDFGLSFKFRGHQYLLASHLHSNLTLFFVDDLHVPEEDLRAVIRQLATCQQLEFRSTNDTPPAPCPFVTPRSLVVAVIIAVAVVAVMCWLRPAP